MTINPPNSGVFQQQLSNAVVNLRNAFTAIQNLNDYITAQGGATFLTSATIGLSAADAAVVTSTFANLAALNNIYQGGAPGAALNYKANSNLLWSGN